MDAKACPFKKEPCDGQGCQLWTTLPGNPPERGRCAIVRISHELQGLSHLLAPEPCGHPDSPRTSMSPPREWRVS